MGAEGQTEPVPGGRDSQALLPPPGGDITRTCSPVPAEHILLSLTPAEQPLSRRAISPLSLVLSLARKASPNEREISLARNPLLSLPSLPPHPQQEVAPLWRRRGCYSGLRAKYTPLGPTSTLQSSITRNSLLKKVRSWPKVT